MGDLQGEELALEELGSLLASGFNGTLGKYSNGLVSRLVVGEMPHGFNASAVKPYLLKSLGLGPSRSDGVLLVTTLEPPKRLGSEAEAKSWLNSVAAIYAQRSGIPMSSPGASAARGGTAGPPSTVKRS